jgi:hypothetical protein
MYPIAPTSNAIVPPGGIGSRITANDERTAARAPWVDNYNSRRRHGALGGLPLDQPCVTNLMADWS